MPDLLETGGERLTIECELPWVTELIAEGAGGALLPADDREPTLVVHVEADRRPFDVRGWEVLTRGAWRRGRDVVLADPCTAGFDLQLSCTPERAEFRYRWRPPRRTHAAAWALRSRFHLLARAVLLQYPVLWWAGTRGRAPLHASACSDGTATALVTAPSGVGRSTFVLDQVRAGAAVTGDNLSVGDGFTLWGLVEPLRVDGGSGRRMPHGRHEERLPNRSAALTPDLFILLERGSAASRASLLPCSSETVARALVTSTYMAGELRRFWSFAATLAGGTGLGPAHPPVEATAAAYAERLPCFTLRLGAAPTPHLAELMATPGVAA